MQTQFLPLQLFRTISIASDRAMNERMVRRPKEFGYFCREIPTCSRMDVVNTIWKNINCRANVVRKPSNNAFIQEWEKRFSRPEIDGTNEVVSYLVFFII